MNTINESIRMKSTVAKSQGIDGWFTTQSRNFENYRFGWMTLFILLQSCLGSVACMFILQNNASDVQLASCAAVTMGSNAMFIAQAPGKWCLLTFYLSILLNTIFILMNI